MRERVERLELNALAQLRPDGIRCNSLKCLLLAPSRGSGRLDSAALAGDHREHYLIQETDKDVITAITTSSFHIAKVLAAALAFDICRPIEIRRGAEVIATVSPSDSPLAKISTINVAKS